MIPVLNAVDHVAPDVVRLRNAMVNVYLVGDREQWVLIDAGLPGGARTIHEAAQTTFGENARPAAIVMTHGHFDHVGGFPKLFEWWDVPVYAHEVEKPHLTGAEDYPSPDPTVGKGIMSLSSFLYPRRAIDLGSRVQQLPSDTSVPNMPGWRWIHTPGHSDGHVSFFRDDDGVLIAGDAFVTTHQESAYNVLMQRKVISGPPAYFTPDWEQARVSVQALAGMPIETAATGHGTPMAGEPLRRGLDELAERFDELAVPKHGKYVPE